MTPLAAAATAAALYLAAAPAPVQQQLQEPEPPPRTLRLTESTEGLELSVATRVLHFARDGGPPALVSLVGAMHVADGSYYDALQAYLDGHDVVLFERVEPRADLGGEVDELPPAERAAVLATRRRMETLLAAAVAHHRETGRAPSPEDLAGAAAAPTRTARRLRRASADAWGRPLRLTARTGGGALEAGVESFGSDGAPGGGGAAADLVLRHPPPGGTHAPDGAASGERGLQAEMADALDLVFQLDGIDYGGAHWRNCDVSLEELEALLAEAGGDASALLGALDGSSLLGRAAGGLLRLVGATRTGRGSLKLVGVEVLARADEVLAAPPPGMERLFEVLLEERNAVVVDDLRAILDGEPELRRIAVFYGAGHLRDLERRLVAELGMTPVQGLWFPALELRFAETGLSPAEIRLLRRTVGSALDRRLGGTRR